MDGPEEKVKEIKRVYQAISSTLDNLNDENFEQIKAQVNSHLSLVNALVQKLRDQYGSENVTKFNVEIQPLIKQINNKFDNIIDKIKAEQSEISKELNNFQNQKKLANYNR